MNTPLKGHYNKLDTAHHKVLLRILGAWCKSSNNGTLSYKDALQRTGCESIQATVCTMRVLWAGALHRVDDHRLTKRVISGERERELENARQRGLEEKDLGLDTTQYAKGVARLWPRG